MKLEMSRVEYWRAPIEDRPGALADKLTPLAAAGADLEFVFARRTPEQPGAGVVYVAPIKGAKLSRAAGDAGFEKAADLAGLRLDAGNAAGLGEKIARTLAGSGLNLRAFLGQTVGNKAVLHLSFDTVEDAAKAQRLLKKLG